jgi:hypothetical protein
MADTASPGLQRTLASRSILPPMHPDDDSPQTDLVHGAFSSDPDEGIALIDDALARGADFTSGGIQPLHDAASNRQPRILQHLINRGATFAGRH